MDSSNAARIAQAGAEPEVVGPAALLRGTARGLEWWVDGHAATDAIVLALATKLAEAPTFFRGSDVRITVEGSLANHALVALAELAGRYDLRIVEIGAPKPVLPPAVVVESGPMPKPLELAEGSSPNPLDEPGEPRRAEWQGGVFEDEEPTLFLEPEMVVEEDFTDQPTHAAMPIPQLPAGTRLVVGPVRSGVILDHSGNLIVFGDVNPGAEVRATGNIVVLGRLRGTAHAAIGTDTGFILALRLEPQQLRIGRRVARAADNDTASNDAEIAYATGEQMVVERYQGRLPRNLATSI
jgi:septum site-determining protein MinC